MISSSTSTRKPPPPQNDFYDVLKHATLHITPRLNITWGGDSQISCEMLLLRQAVPSHCDYYHLLSGADLPLHSMDFIDSFFTAQQGKEFLHFSEEADSISSATRERISLYHPLQNHLGAHRFSKATGRCCDVLQRALHIDRLRSHRGLVLGKGANWFSITNDFAKYVVENWSAWNPIFSSSFCADEMFLQTIALNSPFADHIYHREADDDYGAIMRFIDWKRGTPYVFRKADYGELINSPMLFARKFDERIDSEIIDMITDHVLHESPNEYIGNH